MEIIFDIDISTELEGKITGLASVFAMFVRQNRVASIRTIQYKETRTLFGIKISTDYFGKALVDKIISQCKNQGCRYITFLPQKKSTALAKILQDAGFKEENGGFTLYIKGSY